MSRYVVAWIITWSVGMALAAPLGYDPAEPPVLGDLGLWRMIVVSPLSILLAFGVERILTLSRRLKHSVITPQSMKIQQSVEICAAVAIPSLILFASTSPLIRLAAVLAGVVLVFLMTWIVPVQQVVRVLIAAVLLLIIVNAAFRSLYPLLLDPHNLHRIASACQP